MKYLINKLYIVAHYIALASLQFHFLHDFPIVVFLDFNQTTEGS